MRRIVRPGGRRLRRTAAPKAQPRAFGLRVSVPRAAEPRTAERVEWPAVAADARWPVPAPARRLRLGAALSLALHAGAGLAAVLLMLEARDGTPPGSPAPVEVEIVSADAFDAAYAEAGAQPAVPQEARPADAPSPEIPLPEPVPPLADPERLAVPAAPPVPDPAGIPARDMPPPEPDREAEPAAQPEPAPVPPKQAETEPAPKPPAMPPAKTAQRPVPKVPAKAAPGTPRPAASGRGETGRGAEAVSSLAAAHGASGRSGTAGAGLSDSYRSRVMAHLARYKLYPEAARRQRMRGRVLVTFGLDAGGRVTGVSLSGSSGHGLLDAEALAMVRRASPFPPIPPENGQASASFTAPIVYDMN
ncbi:TonB family protein [Microvirga thermotolerans]|uniref:TonB family protein n=1 Tax=Microvirga thermotolerans TaxID=2651334 RepID=A0A5P9JR86_9HYPH|nr:TonB family protein [Microvirga thermotolerans]QFU14873.1 TonB family protein [Microvirga thermotolerans]